MIEFVAVALPQMGANDVSAVIVEWGKSQGDQAQKGEILCVAETTKSIFDIESPATGYVVPVVEVGTDVPVGEAVAVIASEPVTEEQARQWLADRAKAAAAPVAESAWTVKAELLAKKNGIDLKEVAGTGGKITEADVLRHLEQRKGKHAPAGTVKDLVVDLYPEGRVERIMIVGGGEGAVQILDAISKTPGQRAVAIVDDNAAIQGKSVAGVPVIGGIDTDRVAEMFGNREFDSAVISISTSIPFRARIFDDWSRLGIRFANVIHPSAVVGMNVAMGEGNVILAFCHFGACTSVGNNNFVSAYCSIEHHSQLGSHCSFGPGVVTSSRAEIGDRVRFGTGIYIEPHIAIGRESVIGSGCIIWQHIPEGSILKSKLNYAIRRKAPVE